MPTATATVVFPIPAGPTIVVSRLLASNSRSSSNLDLATEDRTELGSGVPATPGRSALTSGVLRLSVDTKPITPTDNRRDYIRLKVKTRGERA